SAVARGAADVTNHCSCVGGPVAEGEGGTPQGEGTPFAGSGGRDAQGGLDPLAHALRPVEVGPHEADHDVAPAAQVVLAPFLSKEVGPAVVLHGSVELDDDPCPGDEEVDPPGTDPD